MRFSLLVAGIGIALVPACNENKGEGPRMVLATKADTTAIPIPAELPPSDSVPKNIQVDSVIHLQFPQDSKILSVKGYLDKKGNPVICYVPVTNARKLMAVLSPEKPKATIRFSHIYLPNGKSDGPFGSSMRYNLNEQGTYKLYIAPNKMAGDPISTDFNLTVKVD